MITILATFFLWLVFLKGTPFLATPVWMVSASSEGDVNQRVQIQDQECRFFFLQIKQALRLHPFYRQASTPSSELDSLTPNFPVSHPFLSK